MLFDLQGKRRRLVQATYLTLAVLMGGGLVLFGIGGDVAGGLFSQGGALDQSGGDDVAKQQQERLDDANEAFRGNPRDAEALATIVQVHLNRATSDRDETTGQFSLKARSELFGATGAWERYLEANPPEPDADVASSITNAYFFLGNYKKAATAAEIVTEQDPSVEAYLTLAQFLVWSKRKDDAEAAGDKALELAADDERKEVRQQIRATLKSKPPPIAPAERPPEQEGGQNPFQEPGQGGGAPGGTPPGGAPTPGAPPGTGPPAP